MRYFTGIFLLAMLCVGEALAQPLTVSVAGGYHMRSYMCQAGPNNPWYPSVQVDAALFTFAEERLSARAGVYYSYWSDGGSDESPRLCTDVDAFTRQEHTGGVRVFVVSEKGLPLVFSAGVGRQAAHINWLRAASGFTGQPLEDETRYTTIAELGVHVRLPLEKGLHLESGTYLTVHPGEYNRLMHDGYMFSFQLGIGYTLF